ncbi:MAG TPA: tRNA uridine-5-carboxymethylaminomethyl(34) synthesis GTPase MnmE [Rhizomicrobium sp.]|jgi:tRNA modification GTPase|nr:tRNA uridine-5-carboxymethylaminomethyl(34) synthesis GTPase MnmE [Rhizomicrobium sp.]
MNDTIFAPATAPGRAGIAVVRVSGASAKDAVIAVTGAQPPEPRLAALRAFRDFEGETIDEGLVLWFAGPASFTGEDVVEFQLHGGRAIVERVLATLGRLPRMRMAERGEFTRRAVENGKLDLTRAEAIADLVDAETEAQRRQAFRQYEGGLYQMAEGWRGRLIKALAWAEAAIDFAEDEVPAEAWAEVEAAIRELYQEIQRLMDDGRRGEILREGVHITVIGPPNAGKSSFINALARRDVAIVSPIPGTTRDIVEARLDLGGYPVIVADTAGIRETDEIIEAEGVRRARTRSTQGDLTVLVLDGSLADPAAGLDPELVEGAALTLLNKSDLPWAGAHEGHRLSLTTGDGLAPAVSALTELVRNRIGTRDGVALTRERHRRAVSAAAEHLKRAETAGSPELISEDLRLALRAIGELTGRVDVEDLLDVVFRDFCIGK